MHDDFPPRWRSCRSCGSLHRYKLVLHCNEFLYSSHTTKEEGHECFFRGFSVARAPKRTMLMIMMRCSKRCRSVRVSQRTNTEKDIRERLFMLRRRHWKSIIQTIQELSLLPYFMIGEVLLVHSTRIEPWKKAMRWCRQISWCTLVSVWEQATSTSRASWWQPCREPLDGLLISIVVIILTLTLIPIHCSH